MKKGSTDLRNPESEIIKLYAILQEPEFKCFTLYSYVCFALRNSEFVLLTEGLMPVLFFECLMLVLLSEYLLLVLLTKGLMLVLISEELLLVLLIEEIMLVMLF